jgi:hypothetical protein
MKTIFTSIIVAILFASVANSQTMRIERTDVDSTRYGHVTANFKFGIDIYIDELENVNSASFQLKWNFGNHVHFSGYQIGDFGDNGTVFITNPIKIDGTDEKYMNVGIFSGTTVGENEFDNPKLLHLEFAVSSDIPNREQLVFSFVNFFATAFVDSSQTNVEITAEQLELNIHSFINVWPGDSNNDGLVDTRDYNQIGLYFEGNSIQNTGKSFKRSNATIMWTGQQVLVWDNADATFADCDGDGVITVADGMVVFHNDSKTHEEGTGLLGDDAESGLVEEIDESKYNKIPVYSHVTDEYRAITGKINLNKGLSIAHIVPGDLFDGANAKVLKQVKGNTVEMTIGSFNQGFAISEPGVIAYLLVDKNSTTDDLLLLDDQISLGKDNRFRSHGITTDIESDIDDGIEVYYSNGEIHINSEQIISSVELFDINGKKLLERSINSLNMTLDQELNSGIYFLKVDTGNVSIKTISITN